MVAGRESASVVRLHSSRSSLSVMSRSPRWMSLFRRRFLNLMQDIQEEMGLTYLFITHDLSVVKHLSNQIMVMYLGQVVEICDAKQLFRAPVHPYTKALLSAIPIPDPRVKMNKIPLKGRAFVSNQPQTRLSVCKALPVCHTGVHCRRHPAVRDRARSQRSLHQGRAIQGRNGVNVKKRTQI